MICKIEQELNAPLDRKHVKARKQGGGNVSYIEGWHAIAEANRIFGWNGWTRETMDMREVREPELVNGNWRVGFVAKVRIEVKGAFRDGTGFGSGIAKDLGDAYESAVKEAETDAMKRAFMTFGNPFGLALYDKTQANVETKPTDNVTPDALSAFVGRMDKAEALEELQSIWMAHAALHKAPASIKAKDRNKARLSEGVA